jgi:multidrug efflux pump subunit AcrB
LAVLSFITGPLLIPLIPKGFIPKLDRGEFNIVYTSPLPNFSNLGLPGQNSGGTGGTEQNLVPNPQSPIPNPLNDSLQVAKKLEEVVRKSPEVETVFTIVGSRQGQPNKGTLYVKLNRDRTLNTSAVQDQLRAALPSLPGVTTSVEDIQFVDTGGEKPLQVALIGEDLEVLSRAVKDIKTRVEKLPGFADVTVTGEANTKDNILEIEHLDTRRVAYVNANLSGGIALGDATDRVVAVAKEILPPGVSLDLGGDSARSGEIFASFGSTLGLSVLCILVVLIALFRRWIDPIVIIVSLPLSLIGALLALLITRSDFGMIAVIGIIFLFGLTNKNAILLVDYINQLRDTGMSIKEAILKAGPVRMRPILMTTAATILGMLPIALGIGAGSELRSPMAVSIIGGLVASTILSLIVVPVTYSVLNDLQNRFRKS